MDVERYKAGERASLIGIFGNLALAVMKFVAGVYSGSAALIADALDSFSDVLSSLITWIGIKISYKPADETHPYGHYDAEAIAGLIVSIMLALLAYEFARHAVLRLFYAPEQVKLVALLAVGVNLLGKVLLARYTGEVAQRINSPALAASAANLKGDIYTSMAILAGIGASRLGFYALDPIIALAITLLIFKIAVEIGWRNILHLMGTVPSPEMVEEIKRLTREVEGVIDVHRVRVHAMGAYNKVDLHVCVDENIPLKKAHEIAHEVQVKITENMPEVASALVHVEPFDEHHRRVHFNNKK
jgi:cation diffusion facilitator family transporter